MLRTGRASLGEGSRGSEDGLAGSPDRGARKEGWVAAPHDESQLDGMC